MRPGLLLLLAATIGFTGDCFATDQDASAKPGPEHPHLVFAHYMPCSLPLGLNPGNTYWYGERIKPTGDNQICWPVLNARMDKDYEFLAYVDEIRLAKQYGIDGFLVDQLEDNEGYRACWSHLLKAAEVVGGFTIGLMPDYSTLGGDKAAGTVPEKILHWLVLAKDSPALLRYDGKVAVMPYGCGFPEGKDTPQLEKNQIVAFLEHQGIPVAYAALHGLDWGLYAKPYANDRTTGFQTFAFATGSFSPTCGSEVRQRALDYWPSSLMQMGENSFMYYNRGWCYSAPRLSTNYRHMWEWNIAHRDRIMWMQLITWNDQGETAIEPTNNHFMAWQRLTRYYADWFKTSRQPTIARDWLAIFHRPHPYAAVPVVVKKCLASGVPTDEVEAIALLTAPATLVIESGGSTARSEVGAGLQSFIIPFNPGVQRARIERPGQPPLIVTSPVPVHLKPARQNLWFIAADSDHPPRLLVPKWSEPAGWSGTANQQKGTGTACADDAGRWLDVGIEAQVTPSLTEAGVVVRHLVDRQVQLTVRKVGERLAWRLASMEGATATELAGGFTPAHAGAVTLRLESIGDRVIPYCDGILLDGETYVFAPFHGQVGLTAETTTTFSAIAIHSFDPETPVP